MEPIGGSYAGPSKRLFSPNPSYKGMNAHPDKQAIPTDPGNKCNVYVGDVLFQSGASYPAVPQARGGEKYALASSFPSSGAFIRLHKRDEIIPGDIVVRTLDGIVHVEVITAVTDEGTRITGAIGAHWEGVGPSKSNTGVYNRGLAGTYDAEHQSYAWTEPGDGSQGKLYILRAKPR